jgi:hypothetical protein
VTLGATPNEQVAIACTLAPELVGARLADWQELMARSTSRRRVPGGIQLRLARSVDVGALATLLAAEQECCRFFSFTMTVADAEVVLEITAPPDAATLIDSLVGS